MKKLVYALVLAMMVHMSAAYVSFAETAAGGKSKIVSVLDKETFLLDDGSMWGASFDGVWHANQDIVSIASDGHDGWALTRSGKVYGWSTVGKLQEEKEMTDVAKIFNGGYWTKKDGKLWRYGKQVKGLSDVVLIDSDNDGTAAVNNKGEIYYGDRYSSGFRLIGTLTDAVDVRADGLYVALLQKNGDITVYDTMTIGLESTWRDLNEDNPKTVQADAVSMAWEPDQNQTLLFAKKDGTVWRSMRNDKYEPVQIDGLRDVVKLVALPGREEEFFAQKRDGSWILYSEGESQAFEAPAIKSLTLTLSKKTANVGEQMTASVQESYTNGFKSKRMPSKAELTIDKPQVLELQANGAFKVRGIGDVSVTVNAQGLSSKAVLSASLGKPLQNAKNIDGVVYLPLKSVFQAFGGTVNYVAASKSFEINVGAAAIVLQKGSAQATVNGKAVTLKGALKEEKGETLFPAHLLVQALGAKVAWDDLLKQADITLGAGTLSVESRETAQVIKWAKQGTLGNYIGKTYWVNQFQGWERFIKVTVNDIIPDADGQYFVIEFKNAKGQRVKTYEMAASNVVDLLDGGYQFLKFDPYKKYKWSNAIWSKIKQEKVSIGMTKDQVRMSWGDPSHTGVLSAKGLTVETWSYGVSTYVTFTNGKVSSIYQ